MKGFVLGLAVEGRKLWRRLSPPQRVFVVGITAVAAVGLAWMAFDARSPGFSLVSDQEPDDQGSDLLEENRGTSLESGTPEGGEWLDDGGSIFPDPQRLQYRREESKRRRVQGFISGIADIRQAFLEITKRTPNLFRNDGFDGSAAVTLYLEPGVESLTSRKARVVRKIVCGAFGLRPESVTLTDNMGNAYDVAANTSDLEKNEARYFEDLDKDIRELLSGLFAADEFKLVVRGAPPEGGPSISGGLLGPGSRAGIELSSPGEGGGRMSGGVNVVLRCDRDAVQRLLESEGGSLASVEKFRADQQQAIENLLFPRPSRVTVLADPFKKNETDVAAASVRGLDTPSAAGVGNTRREGGGWQDWFEPGWPLTPLLGLALLLVLLMVPLGGGLRRWALSRRGLPLNGGGATGRSPPRQDAVSTAGPAGQGSRPWSVFPRGGVAPGGSDLLSPANGGHDSLLSATERMSEWVQERPQTAASVLRVWLQQPAEVSADRGGRS